jgi:hypothetical protein
MNGEGMIARLERSLEPGGEGLGKCAAAERQSPADAHLETLTIALLAREAAELRKLRQLTDKICEL